MSCQYQEGRTTGDVAAYSQGGGGRLINVPHKRRKPRDNKNKNIKNEISSMDFVKLRKLIGKQMNSLSQSSAVLN